MALLISVAAWAALGWLALRWSTLTAGVRKSIQGLLLLAAVASFATAPFLSGTLRQPMGPFIAGPNLYPAETVERSSRTAAIGIGLGCLSLFALARWGHALPVRHPVAKALALTIVVLLLRLTLEKLGLPLRVVLFFGIIWLILPISAFLGAEAARTASLRRFWAWMFAYTYTLRLLVVVLMLAATHWHLGTHLDNTAVTRFNAFGREVVLEPHSWQQVSTLILMPQLIMWAGLTLLAGLVIGWPSYAFTRRRIRIGIIGAR